VSPTISSIGKAKAEQLIGALVLRRDLLSWFVERYEKVGEVEGEGD